MLIKRYRDDLIRSSMAGQEPPLTSEQLAEKTGLSRTTISKIINGSLDIRLPSLIAVADALGLSLETLFTMKEGEQVQEEEPAAA